MDSVIDFSLKGILTWLKFMVYGSFTLVLVSLMLMLFVLIFLKNLFKNW